jgi:thioredoxin-related protein
MVLKIISRLCLAGILLSNVRSSLYAQETNAIRFERNLSMKEVLSKARKENKFVFIDVMATWCAPCKKMDREVFSDEAVAHLLNENFISIKVQGDSTMEDDAATVKFRKDAKDIDQKYRITSYPTYIFLNPDGVIVEKTGIKRVATPALFKTRAGDLLNGNNSYVTFLQRYAKGERPYDGYAKAISQAKWFEDNVFAKKLGREYIEKYLNNLKVIADFKLEDFEVMGDYLSFSDKKLSTLLYERGAEIDSVIKYAGLSKSVLSIMITKEKINAFIFKDAEFKKPIEGNPDWSKYQASIAERFGEETAAKLILSSKMDFYSKRKDWVEYAVAANEYIQRYAEGKSLIGSMFINNTFYEKVFLHVDDKDILLRSAGLQYKMIIADNLLKNDRRKVLANQIDTYANLLYRGGKTGDAIEWQQKAALMDTVSKNIKVNLEKMKSGKPTWVD